MTQNFEGKDQLIKNWLQNKNTVDFLGVWERINNPNFNLVGFHQIKTEAGLNRFVMSAKQWRFEGCWHHDARPKDATLDEYERWGLAYHFCKRMTKRAYHAQRVSDNLWRWLKRGNK